MRRFISVLLMAAVLLIPAAACQSDLMGPPEPAPVEQVIEPAYAVQAITLPIVVGSTFWATYGAVIESAVMIGWTSTVMIALYGEEIMDALHDAWDEWLGTEHGQAMTCGTVDMIYTCWS